MTNPIPSLPTDPVTAGLDVAAEGLALAGELQAEANTPEMVAAKKARLEQLARDTDQAVATKAAAGDPEAVKELERRSS